MKEQNITNKPNNTGIKEKLESIRNICRERKSCFASETVETDCTYYENCCFPTGYPADWSDENIEQLASELERPKARWEDVSLNEKLMFTQLLKCTSCKSTIFVLYRINGNYRYCPNCGAEMER